MCGTPVRVVSADEGTNSYELAYANLRAEYEAAIRALRALRVKASK